MVSSRLARQQLALLVLRKLETEHKVYTSDGRRGHTPVGRLKFPLHVCPSQVIVPRNLVMTDNDGINQLLCHQYPVRWFG